MAKIVILSTRYDLGGAPRLASQIASNLQRRGHSAEAWFLYFHSDPHTIHEERTRIFLPHPPRGPKDLARMTGHLWRAMQDFRPDVFFGVQPLANTLGATTAALAKCPRRFGGQHNPAESQRPSLRALEKLVGTFLYTGNITVSNAVRDTYGSYPRSYRRKLSVIYNGIPPRGDKRDKSFAREQFGLPQARFLIGTVGHHDTDQKNHEFLIDLLPRMPEVHLAIAGEGRRRKFLEDKMAALGVGSRVHLVGGIEARAVECFLDALDVFVFPSRFEGFGLALLEAMQSGLPVIGNDLPVFHEILGDENGEAHGILISTNAPEEWSAMIMTLKNDPGLYRNWSRQALLGARRFSFVGMMDAYERMCGSVKRPNSPDTVHS